MKSTKRARAKKVEPIFVIRFAGEVDEENTSEFLMLFDEARSKCKNIRIIINSSGGDPDCAFAIYDAIISSKVCVETVAEGSVVSAAVIIYLVGKKRYITPHSVIMVHKARMLNQGPMTEDECKLAGKGLEIMEKMYVDVICEKTGQSRQKVLGDISRGRYIYAEEAVKSGYAHKII